MYRYKHLALKYHPLKNHSNMAVNLMKFNEVCEAFDVLYNGKSTTFKPLQQSHPFSCIAETKSIYDEYGEYGLKEGVVKPDGSKCSHQSPIRET